MSAFPIVISALSLVVSPFIFIRHNQTAREKKAPSAPPSPRTKEAEFFCMCACYGIDWLGDPDIPLRASIEYACIFFLHNLLLFAGAYPHDTSTCQVVLPISTQLFIAQHTLLYLYLAYRNRPILIATRSDCWINLLTISALLCQLPTIILALIGSGNIVYNSSLICAWMGLSMGHVGGVFMGVDAVVRLILAWTFFRPALDWINESELPSDSPYHGLEMYGIWSLSSVVITMGCVALAMVFQDSAPGFIAIEIILNIGIMVQQDRMLHEGDLKIVMSSMTSMTDTGFHVEQAFAEMSISARASIAEANGKGTKGGKYKDTAGTAGGVDPGEIEMHEPLKKQEEEYVE